MHLMNHEEDWIDSVLAVFLKAESLLGMIKNERTKVGPQEKTSGDEEEGKERESCFLRQLLTDFYLVPRSGKDVQVLRNSS